MQPEPMMQLIAEVIHEEQAGEVLVLEVAALTILADYFIIATGRNVNHIRSLADAAKDKMKEQGILVLHEDGYAEGRWVVLDFGAIILHLFRQQDREYYRLEQLWGEGKVMSYPFADENLTQE